MNVNGWSEPIFIIAPSESKSKSSPITTLLATDKPPSVCKEPSVVLVASVVLLTFIIPAVDTVTPVLEPIVVIPPLVANEVVPLESSVDTLVSFVTSNVPAIAVLPLALTTVNLLVAISKSPSIPVAPVTSNVGAVIFSVEVQPVEEFHVNFLSLLLFNIKPAPLI